MALGWRRWRVQDSLVGGLARVLRRRSAYRRLLDLRGWALPLLSCWIELFGGTNFARPRRWGPGGAARLLPVGRC